MFSLMVAMGKNRAIGKGNKLLCHLRGDLQNFKNVTMNRPVIMGRKTFESIGRPLPGRRNIVLTRDQSFKPEGVEVYGSIDEVIAEFKDKNAVVIGGGEIYQKFLPFVDTMYITEFDASPDADTFFPEWNKNEWKLGDQMTHPKDEQNDHAWQFSRYTKIN